VTAVAVARWYVRLGALWAVVAASIALLAWLPIAAGWAPLGAIVGPGRLDAAYRLTLFWGALSLPLAGALFWCCGAASADGNAVRVARVALWLWQLALIVGSVLILLGNLASEPWLAAPGLVQATLWLAGALWATALWSCLARRGSPLSIGEMFGVSAATGLVVFQGIALLATRLTGADQALVLALAAEGLRGVWLAGAGLAVAALVLPRATGRQLFSRRLAVAGWLGWIALVSLASGHVLAPDLYPAAAARLTLAATALLAIPAILLGIVLGGAMIGTRALRPLPAAAVLAWFGVLAFVAVVLAEAFSVPASWAAGQFTTWSVAHVLLPPEAAGLLLAMAASLWVWHDTGTPLRLADGRRLQRLAVLAALAALVVLWPLGLAGAAAGPSAWLARAEAVLRLPGAVLLWLAVAQWLVALRHAPSAPDAELWPEAPPAVHVTWRPIAVVGTTLGLLVIALFVTLFLPLSISAERQPTAQSAARELDAARFRADGRARYVADGCVSCHTQRVRAGAADTAYGPPSQPGDYDNGPPLNGERRMGPDLMWVGDRFPTAEAMTQALAAHGPTGVLPMPWLVDSGGLTDSGAPLAEYLTHLRSQGEVSP
jgi:hypothetical protein